MKRHLTMWGVGALVVGLFPGGQAIGADRPHVQAQNPAIRPARVIVKFRPNVAASQRAALHRAHGHEVERNIPQLDMHVVKVPPGKTVEEVIARYSVHPLVEFAEPEIFMEPQLTPNDPWFEGYQIPLQQLSSEAAWDVTTGAPDVPIAFLDTGLDIDHFEFVTRIASGEIYGYDFADDDSDFDDLAGHGTMVGGVIGGMTNNGVGLAVASWQNPMVVLRSAFGLDTVEAIAWATDNGTRVISMSYGAHTPTSWQEAAMQYAFDHGVVLVGAAGNEGDDLPVYPAAYPTVLAVTGVSSSGEPIGYNWGDWIDLSAPGGGVLTTKRPQDDTDGDGLGFVGGTSIAAPFVASAAGLVLSVNPDLTPLQVMDILRSTADDLGDPGFDELTGWGRVNFHAAVLAAADTPPETDTTPPTVSVVAPSPGDVLSGMVTILVAASDDTSVSHVDLYVDGSFVSSDTVPPHEWSFDTTVLADGEHFISAVAYDAAGNSAESAPVQVTVDNSTPAAECDSDSDCNDWLFCNGVETCDADGACQPGSDPCPGEDCVEATDSCAPTNCNHNGTCEPGEDCQTCPDDCLSGSGASCGNGMCETADGEDCLSCPQDCNGQQTGKPSDRFCCGDGDGYNPVGCEDARCHQGEYACADEPVGESCCGDDLCEGIEDRFNCEVDCGPAPFCGDGSCDADEDSCNCTGDCGAHALSELHCANGIDDDCNGYTDCDDPGCTDEPACQCAPKGATCAFDGDCCTAKCRHGRCR
jgi:thermitase